MESVFGKRNNNAEKHWQTINIIGEKISKPIIICLSGNATITEREANGFCKLAESCIGKELSQKVDFIGVAYQHAIDSKNGQFNASDRSLIVDKILIPLCEDNNGTILSTEECCRNLSKITFFTFCHGSVETIKIINNFYAKLQEKGICEEDINKIGQSLLEVSYASTNINACPKISLGSMQDVGGEVFAYWYLGTKAEKEDVNDYVAVCDQPGYFCGKPFPQARPFCSITVKVDSILNENFRNKKTDDNISSWLNNVEEDHNIGYFKKDRSGNLMACVNSKGKTLLNIMELCLQKRIKNSLENIQNNRYKKTDIQGLYNHIQHTINASKEREKERPLDF